jgi:hypothetical protein
MKEATVRYEYIVPEFKKVKIYLPSAVGRYATGPCSVSVAAPFFFFFV